MEKAIRREIPPVPATRKTAENDDDDEDEKDWEVTANEYARLARTGHYSEVSIGERRRMVRVFSNPRRLNFRGFEGNGKRSQPVAYEY
jgi:hypothetical protein